MVFPDPVGPTMAIISPAAASKEISDGTGCRTVGEADAVHLDPSLNWWEIYRQRSVRDLRLRIQNVEYPLHGALRFFDLCEDTRG